MYCLLMEQLLLCLQISVNLYKNKHDQGLVQAQTEYSKCVQMLLLCPQSYETSYYR